MAVGELTYDAMRRPTGFALADVDLSPACTDAVRAVMLSALDESGVLPAMRHVVVVVLGPDFIECHDLRLAAREVRVGGTIAAPRKVRDVQPRYPDSARKERVQGVVIVEGLVTQAGCLRDARVVRNPDTRLSLASLDAVTRWRFEGARVDGVPVDVRLWVTVNFWLQ